MQLPQYTDDEVKCFHPVFEACAIKAIANMGLEKTIRVMHHRSFNGITVDFSIERIQTSKIVLLVEIKRTQSAVESTRYRHQALSYRKEADHMSETNYYILTNLEKTELFRYDQGKSRVSSQLIHGSPFIAGSFNQKDRDLFIVNLTKQIEIILNIAITDQGKYDDNIEKLYYSLEDKINNYPEWHKTLMPFSYEYIRGASANYSKLSEKIKLYRWNAVENYTSQPSRISEKGSSIDFEHVFKKPFPQSNDADAFNNELLENAYKNGKTRGQAEDIAEIVSKLLEPKGLGIVETDEELARLLSIVSESQLDFPILTDELICDPASGSGRLLVAAAQTSFNELAPYNFWANEIEDYFSETLSLRLGLHFADTITPDTAPKITIDDINNLIPEDFSQVKIILLNPPYISGVYSKKEKLQISKTIKKITGLNSLTSKGQIGLEVPFLELVHVLSASGTVIAAIMPYALLTRKSPEVQSFRNFLIHNFGLVMIVTYPRSGLFENVIKKTCIIVGKKDNPSKTIDRVEIKVPIERLDLNEFKKSLKDKASMRACTISSEKNYFYINSIENGWLSDIKNIAQEWFSNALLNNFSAINKFVLCIKRGTSGNTGSSDLSAMHNEDLIKIVPIDKRLPAINNSNNMQKILVKDNAPCVSPEINFNGDEYNDYVPMLIQKYLSIKSNAKKTSKQEKAPLSYDKVLHSLKRDVKISPDNTVLLPRGTRANCSVGVCLTPYVISTNFIVIQCNSKTEALLIGSWLFCIFAQVQMEYLSHNQEGLRKLEKKEIEQLMIPNIYSISEQDVNNLITVFENSEPINCYELKIRSIDEQWANLLSNKPDTLLREAFDLLSDLIEERDPKKIN